MLVKTTPPARQEVLSFSCCLHHSFRSTGNFLNMNLIFKRSHLEDDLEDKIINRIFGYKFVLRMIYSFESGEEI